MSSFAHKKVSLMLMLMEFEGPFLFKDAFFFVFLCLSVLMCLPEEAKISCMWVCDSSCLVDSRSLISVDLQHADTEGNCQ